MLRGNCYPTFDDLFVYLYVRLGRLWITVSFCGFWALTFAQNSSIRFQ